MLIIHTATGKIRQINDAAVRLLHTARVDMIDSDVWERHPVDEREKARELWEETVSTGFGERVLVHCTGDSCTRLRVTSWQPPLASGTLIQRVMRPAT